MMGSVPFEGLFGGGIGFGGMLTMKDGGYIGGYKNSGAPHEMGIRSSGITAKQLAKSNKNLSYYDPKIDPFFEKFASYGSKFFTDTPFGINLPLAHIALDALGLWLGGRKPTFGKKGFLNDLNPKTYGPQVDALTQAILQPYAEIAKGSGTKGDWLNAGLTFIPGAGATRLAPTAKSAISHSVASSKLPSFAKVKLVPQSLLKDQFQILKKSGAEQEIIDKSRFELALKDSLIASQSKGFIPLMDFPKIKYKKLYEENLNMPKIIEEPIQTDIDNGRYLFRFTKGELPEDQPWQFEEFLSEIKNKKNLTGEFPSGMVRHKVEVIDLANNGRQVGYIEYDPISGFIRYRSTDHAYQRKGWSEYLYNKAASMSRIRHSGTKTPQGSASASAMGGFMHYDDVFNYGTIFKTKKYLNAIKAKKKDKKRKRTVITDADLGTTQVSPSAPWSASSNAGDSAAARAMQETLNQRDAALLAWRSSPDRTYNNYPFGYSGNVEWKDHEELLKLMQKPDQPAGVRPLILRISGMASGGYVNPSYSSNMSIPKFEDGINMVPANMLAMLHKNEAVIPANMNPYNPNAKAANSNALYNINVTLNGSNMDPQEVATAIRREMAVREMMAGPGRKQ
jgi:hypothetical protein